MATKCRMPCKRGFSGKPFDIGRAHGRLLPDAVRWNVANFWSACAAAGLERPVIFDSARRIAQDYSDSVVEEIGGIAAGAGVDIHELLAFNLCRGFLFADECTVLFAMGDATASGNVLFLKNSDKIGSASMVGPNFYQNKEVNVVLAIRPEGGPAMVGVAAAGSTGFKMGVNDRGLAVGTNIVRTSELAARGPNTTQMRALDRAQLARDGLGFSTAMEAAAATARRVAENPTATPGNIEFVDSTAGVIVEGSYDRVALQVVRSGIGSRANAFVALRELNDPADFSSQCRYARAQRLLMENSGRLTPERMKRFSQDHSNGPGPNSICRHGERFEEETSQSAMIVELNRRNPRQTRFWIALGKPCWAWPHPDGNLEGGMDQLDRIPAGFLAGDTWKRFWREQPSEVPQGSR